MADAKRRKLEDGSAEAQPARAPPPGSSALATAWFHTCEILGIAVDVAKQALCAVKCLPPVVAPATDAAGHLVCEEALQDYTAQCKELRKAWKSAEQHRQECIAVFQSAQEQAVADQMDANLQDISKRAEADMDTAEKQLAESFEALNDCLDKARGTLRALLILKASTPDGSCTEKHQELAARDRHDVDINVIFDYIEVLDIHDNYPGFRQPRELYATTPMDASPHLLAATIFTWMKMNHVDPIPDADGKFVIQEMWMPQYTDAQHGVQPAKTIDENHEVYIILRSVDEHVYTPAQMGTLCCAAEFKRMVALYAIAEWPIPSWMHERV